MNREGGWGPFYHSYVLILMDIIINQFPIKGFLFLHYIDDKSQERQLGQYLKAVQIKQ